MVDKKDLLAFQKSKAYKELIEKTKNKKISLEEGIINLYHEGRDVAELIYNMHNHSYSI